MKFLLLLFLISFLNVYLVLNQVSMRKKKVEDRNDDELNETKEEKKKDKKLQKEMKKIDQILNANANRETIKKPENTEPSKNTFLPEKPNSSKKIDKEIKAISKELNKLEKEIQVKKKLKVMPINQQVGSNIQIAKNNLPVSQAQQITPLNSNNAIIQSTEFSLPEININKFQKIEQFYPYFFKTGLIDFKNMPGGIFNPLTALDNQVGIPFSQNMIQSPQLCHDLNCDICDKITQSQCTLCRLGFYLLQGKCVNVCPQDHIADAFSRQCVGSSIRQRNTFSRVTYLKAFSIGSCKNICGKRAEDCSCQGDCVHYGDCCSDYRDCELLIRKNTMFNNPLCEKKNPNCELCSDMDNDLNLSCSQCKPGLWLKDENCYQSCEQGDRILKNNLYCFRVNKCLVENCAECEENNPSVCKRCMNGLFLQDNQCKQSCTDMYRADRMNWMCLEAPVFAWYWIYPSRSSCKGKCDFGILPTEGRDCSCREDCFKYGNCCQDVEQYCYKFILS
jgi:hypothetical protein